MKNFVWDKFILIILMVFFSAAAYAEAHLFDAPLKIRRVSLGAAETKSAQAPMIKCHYYKDFMVKEIDLREKGAAQLSIIPVVSKNKFLTCQKENLSNEHVIKKWNGYFQGVKTPYVFFRADDGINQGIGMAIFDGRDGRKLFEDSVYSSSSRIFKKVGDNNFSSVNIKNSILHLRYKKIYAATCSLMSEGKLCWKKIKKETGLKKETMPDCAPTYQKENMYMASSRCEREGKKDALCIKKELEKMKEKGWDNPPSVIGYDVDVVLKEGLTIIKPMGGAIYCWPAS